MNRRIEEIRRDAGLSQETFGERLNVSMNYVWMIENGKRVPSERLIKSICREFGIREEWLRDGTGPMKEEKPRDIALAEELDKLITAGSDDFRKALVAWLVRMPPEHWQALETITRDLLRDMRNLSEPAPAPRNVHDWTRAEMDAEYKRQADAEEADRKKGTDATSTGSPRESGADCA